MKLFGKTIERDPGMLEWCAMGEGGIKIGIYWPKVSFRKHDQQHLQVTCQTQILWTRGSHWLYSWTFAFQVLGFGFGFAKEKSHE